MNPGSDEIKQIPKGYTIRNYHDENGKLMLPWSEIKRIARIKADGIKKKRGQYIGKSIDIEYMLNEIINVFLFGHDLKKKELFHELILDADYFTFMNKKKVVEKILNKLSEKFPDIRPIKKDFLQSIMNIMTSRNKLAHGEIIIDINLNEVFLRYYESGYKEIKMTPDFFKKFDKWVSDVINIYLTRIIPKVITSDNPIQYLQ